MEQMVELGALDQNLIVIKFDSPKALSVTSSIQWRLQSYVVGADLGASLGSIFIRDAFLRCTAAMISRRDGRLRKAAFVVMACED